MSNRSQGNRGFTLIEVVFALTLLAFGLLAVAGGLASITRVMNEGRALTEVASLVGTQVARVRSEGCSANGRRVEGQFLVQWNGTSAWGGRLVTISVERMSSNGFHIDSVTWFQKCSTR